MLIVESLLIALGTGVAKYLAKEALPKDWQDQIAAELVSLGVRQLSARPEEDPIASAIGGRLKTLYDRSSLAENDKTAVLIEVIRTLAGARTDVQHLVEQDLDPDRLRRELLVLRTDATAQFSADETALYEQMLWEVSQGMVQVAGRLDGFSTAQAQTQLGHQRVMLDQQAAMGALLQSLAPSLASWLDGPSQQAAHFEQEVYRPALVEKLNKLEPLGIDEGDRYIDTLRLTDTFVEHDLLLTVWEQKLEKIPEIDRLVSKHERRLPVLQALTGIQRLMVVGAAGSGKSTFLQWLADMHWLQIEVFVRRWHDALDKVTTHDEDRRKIGQNRDGAIKLLQREAALRKLAATPLLCAMICALYQRQGDHIAPERLELYSNCVAMLLWDRDRRHPRRRVPALADYHQFKKDQLLRLLSHLAYWMMNEGASALSQERVVAQFGGYLPYLGLEDPALGERAFEYFSGIIS